MRAMQPRGMHRSWDVKRNDESATKLSHPRQKRHKQTRHPTKDKLQRTLHPLQGETHLRA
eukprot:scaffold287_cov337-Pavlova_lutheri.AAC.156